MSDLSVLVVAGIAGLGLGIGLVVGVAVMRWIRHDPDHQDQVGG